MSDVGPSSPVEEPLFRLEVFRDVAPAAVRELLGITTLQSLPANHVLFTQGDPLSEDAWLVVTGRLSVSVVSGKQNRVMADVWPGEIVGEAALFARGRLRSATVRTVTPSTALRISRSALVGNDDQPALVALEMHLLETMAKRIRSTTTTLQRVVLEQRAHPPAPPPAAGRPARPAPAEPLTLAQRLARWFDTTN